MAGMGFESFANADKKRSTSGEFLGLERLRLGERLREAKRKREVGSEAKRVVKLVRARRETESLKGRAEVEEQKARIRLAKQSGRKPSLLRQALLSQARSRRRSSGVRIF